MNRYTIQNYAVIRKRNKQFTAYRRRLTVGRTLSTVNCSLLTEALCCLWRTFGFARDDKGAKVTYALDDGALRSGDALGCAGWHDELG